MAGSKLFDFAQNKPASLEERVLAFIMQHSLVPGGQPLLVAVSGGPDSVCLLHVLVKLRTELNTEICVAHLDHGLRGAESAADARHVAGLAKQLGVPAIVEQRDVKAYRARAHLSLEEAARVVRYGFFAEAARKVGADRVAVGHTADDHVETLLMHLVRGAGTRGLRGLQPSSLWRSPESSLLVVRPLLPIRREETQSYCQANRLMPRLDTTNLSMSPLRNRIRLQLLPLLQRYNPRIVDALLRLAHIASDEIAFLDDAVAAWWDRIVRAEGNALVLSKKEVLQLPDALRRHLLRAAIERLAGDLKDIEAGHIEDMMTAMNKQAGKRIALPGNLVFGVEYDRYVLAQEAALSPLPPLAGEFPLNIPGETLIPGWRVETAINGPERVSQGDSFTAFFDLAKTGEWLVVRTRRRGDRFQPLGMAQPKKLGEFMIDSKIPQAWRPHVPIVASRQQIVWVVGWRIDERVKVTESTRQVLRLRFEQRG
ncbi:MAG: tRNA lysidine(34) synthetase TilS [Chloroflexi bacterium]|nr:tRNA lysidine(34) synthetase TilS [Chloroflexota bacterium]